MMKRVLLVALLLTTALTSASPALADPPLDQNSNAEVVTFHCTRGAETQTFVTVSIAQSAAIALQLVDGTGVIMFVHVEVNGQVVYDRPGLAGRSDLWTCTEEGFTFVAQMLLTPRG
jgi:hypothetical protein